jgi:hypothetical protein
MPLQQAVAGRQRKGREELAQEDKEWGIWIRRPDSLPPYTLTHRLGGAVRNTWCPHPPARATQTLTGGLGPISQTAWVKQIP